MEGPKKITSLLYLDRNNFTYFDTVVGGSIVYQYPSDVISDLEVINEDLLHQQIIAMIQENNLTSTQLTVVLSPALLFEKKLPLPAEQKKDTDDIQKFVDTVPFESVSFTTFTMADGVLVLAANTSFFLSMKQAFEKQGFIVSNVIPTEVVGEDLTNGVTLEIAGRIIAKIDSIKQYNLLQQEHQVILPADKNLQLVPHERKSQNRVYVLTGVFIVLVSILIVMLLLQQ